MIKCNVVVCGTVSRSAQIKTNREGKPFLAMSLNVEVPAIKSQGKMLDISIAKDVASQDERQLYPFGTRVVVTGVLTMHKSGEALYLNLSASDIKTAGAEEKDSIRGEMEFRGTLGKNIVPMTNKNGKPYFTLSGFSSERNGTNGTGNPAYDFTWVRFFYFGQSCPTWVQPKVGADIRGEVTLSLYNEHLDISCHVRDWSEWRKQEVQPNAQ